MVLGIGSSSRRIMRWYCVLCFCASLLKNSTLRLFSAIVTLTPSSRKTRSSGRGRKSGTTFSLPRGSSVYRTVSLIRLLAFPPVNGSEDSDEVVTVRESDRHDSPFHPTEAVVPSFARAVQ